jgi:hypothetical protein
MVVYAETHSRPDDHDQLPDHGRDDGLQGDPPSESGSEALLVSTSPEHRELACPTRVPSGSARKSAAIIPFVNKTLTSGAPIASSPEIVNEFNSCGSVNGHRGRATGMSGVPSHLSSPAR